jgi:hypothetical protein
VSAEVSILGGAEVANLRIYRLLEPLLLLCNIPPKSAHVIGLS